MHVTHVSCWYTAYAGEGFGSLLCAQHTLQPFKPQYPHTNSPHWYSYISLKISWESLIKDRRIFSLVVIWLILITISLDNVWILLGENWCWSLLGLKGLIHVSVSNVMVPGWIPLTGLSWLQGTLSCSSWFHQPLRHFPPYCSSSVECNSEDKYYP